MTNPPKTLDKGESSSIYQQPRENMVVEQLIYRGITDPKVLKAMSEVPRELFLREGDHDFAYLDSPVEIGYGQTISQPYIVAYMLEKSVMSPKGKVLEIGTGLGYQAALVGLLSKDVITVERIRALAVQAKKNLARFGSGNVTVVNGDGLECFREFGPYDNIICAARVDKIPTDWIDQLNINGIIVCPEGPPTQTNLVRIQKLPSGVIRETMLAVMFVDMKMGVDLEEN